MQAQLKLNITFYFCQELGRLLSESTLCIGSLSRVKKVKKYQQATKKREMRHQRRDVFCIVVHLIGLWMLSQVSMSFRASLSISCRIICGIVL